MTDRPLWSVEAMAAAMRTAPAGGLPASVPGISIDTRTIAAGRGVLRHQGRQPRRPRLRRRGASGGRRACGRRRARRDAFPADARRCSSFRCARRLARACARSARRARAKIVASPARSARPAPRRRCGSRSAGRGDPRVARLLQQPLGRAASLARCPEDARYAVFEIGMNHAGEIEPLTRLVRPQVAITTDRARASQFFGLGRGDRGRQGRNLPRARASTARRCSIATTVFRPPRTQRARGRRGAHRVLRRATSARTRGL